MKQALSPTMDCGLGLMYVTDRQTSDAHHHLMLQSYGGGA